MTAFIILGVTVIAAWFALQSTNERLKRIRVLNRLLEEENDGLRRNLQGERVPFANAYEETKAVFDKVYRD